MDNLISDPIGVGKKEDNDWNMGALSQVPSSITIPSPSLSFGFT
jgi:hypothetical protein